MSDQSEYWQRNNLCVDTLKQAILTRIPEEELKENITASGGNMKMLSQQLQDECWSKLEHPEWFGHTSYYVKPYLALCVKLGIGDPAYAFLNKGDFPHHIYKPTCACATCQAQANEVAQKEGYADAEDKKAVAEHLAKPFIIEYPHPFNPKCACETCKAHSETQEKPILTSKDHKYITWILSLNIACNRHSFGDYYNCIATHREKCRQKLQNLCKRYADGDIHLNQTDGEQLTLKTTEKEVFKNVPIHVEVAKDFKVEITPPTEEEKQDIPSIEAEANTALAHLDQDDKQGKQELAEEIIPTGVPKGFYPNEYLVKLNNSGWLPATEQGKYPIRLECWGCKEPLVVCGYPHYICKNNHYYNVKTEEKWNWKGTDEVYHGLLRILQGKVEPTYQKLFHPKSRLREHNEASKLSTSLCGIGDMLYDKLEVNEPNPYHWGRDTLRHHGGIRFAIHIMQEAIDSRKPVAVDRWNVSAEEFEAEGFMAEYRRASIVYIEQYGEEAIKTILLSVEQSKAKMPTQTSQATLF